MNVEKITSGWLKEKFGWAVSQQDVVSSVELTSGLMGRIYKIECAGNHFIYKIPPMGKSGWQQIFLEAGLMNREVQSYKFLFEEHSEIGRNIAPAYFWSEVSPDGSGALALEDLTQSTTRASFADGLTYNQAKAAIHSLAQLHSISPPMNLGDLSPSYEWVYTAQSNQLINAIREGINDLSNLMTDRLPALLSTVELNHLLSIDLDKVALDAHGQAKLTSFCHGDSWCSNILFQHSKNPEDGEKAFLIDWQFFMWGNPLTDIALLLMSSVDVDERRLWTENLLEEYCAAVKEKKGIVYDFKDCYGDYKLAQNYAALVMFASLETYTNSMCPSEYYKLYARTKGIIEEITILDPSLNKNLGQQGFDYV